MDGRLEFVQRVDRDLERLRQLLRQRPYADVIQVVEEHAAQPDDGVRLAGRMHRDVDGDFLAGLEGEEIDVEEAAVARIDLNAMDEDAVLVLAVDHERDDRVRVDGLAQVIELMRVEGYRNRLDTVAEDDGRHSAGLAQVRDPLADFGPAGSGQDCRGGAHWLDPPARFDRHAAESTGREVWASYVAAERDLDCGAYHAAARIDSLTRARPSPRANRRAIRRPRSPEARA